MTIFKQYPNNDHVYCFFYLAESFNNEKDQNNGNYYDKYFFIFNRYIELERRFLSIFKNQNIDKTTKDSVFKKHSEIVDKMMIQFKCISQHESVCTCPLKFDKEAGNQALGALLQALLVMPELYYAFLQTPRFVEFHKIFLQNFGFILEPNKIQNFRIDLHNLHGGIGKKPNYKDLPSDILSSMFKNISEKPSNDIFPVFIKKYICDKKNFLRLANLDDNKGCYRLDKSDEKWSGWKETSPQHFLFVKQITGNYDPQTNFCKSLQRVFISNKKRVFGCFDENDPHHILFFQSSEMFKRYKKTPSFLVVQVEPMVDETPMQVPRILQIPGDNNALFLLKTFISYMLPDNRSYVGHYVTYIHEGSHWFICDNICNKKEVELKEIDRALLLSYSKNNHNKSLFFYGRADAKSLNQEPPMIKCDQKIITTNKIVDFVKKEHIFQYSQLQVAYALCVTNDDEEKVKYFNMLEPKYKNFVYESVATGQKISKNDPALAEHGKWLLENDFKVLNKTVRIHTFYYVIESSPIIENSYKIGLILKTAINGNHCDVKDFDQLVTKDNINYLWSLDPSSLGLRLRSGTILHFIAKGCFGQKPDTLYKILEHLASKGADFNYLDYSLCRNTPLMWAIANAQYEIAAQLINIGSKYGAKLDILCDGNSPLHLLLAKGYHVESLDNQKFPEICENLLPLLAKEPKLINQPNEEGYTPLHIAVARRDLEFCKVLVTWGADVSAKGPKGETPLDMLNRSEEQVDAFLQSITPEGARYPANWSGNFDPDQGPECVEKIKQLFFGMVQKGSFLGNT